MVATDDSPFTALQFWLGKNCPHFRWRVEFRKVLRHFSQITQNRGVVGDCIVAIAFSSYNALPYMLAI